MNAIKHPRRLHFHGSALGLHEQAFLHSTENEEMRHHLTDRLMQHHEILAHLTSRVRDT
jgi:hypothetical protein